MLQALFHAWERRLASVTTDRVVRPFEWGLDWIASGSVNGNSSAASSDDTLGRWVSEVMTDTDAFFTPGPTDDYTLSDPAPDGDRLLSFPSAFSTPHAENNIVRARLFPARGTPIGAVLVLPQWNADPGGHVGLCKLLAMRGMTALRLSLPYHDQRMPPELHRADYIVSSNVARTVQVCRQAVLDARRAIAWLDRQGFDRIGILGSSLGSCLALLTTAHEPLVKAAALNHVSPYFADVVWRGLSTAHVRQGFEGHISLERLRELWRPISPAWFLDRMHNQRTLLVYAKYDLTFPVDLSELLVRQFREHGVPHEVGVLPCGHYTSGKAPFKFMDGWLLSGFLRRALGPSESR
jgi:dienelactone hydrolase